MQLDALQLSVQLFLSLLRQQVAELKYHGGPRASVMHPPLQYLALALSASICLQMNSLDALMSVCAKIGTRGEALLEAYRPRAYAELVNGRSLAAAGCEPILHMRGFQSTKQLPPALEADILSRKNLA